LSKGRTDNSFLGDKIALRFSMVPKKKMLNVLDAFHGNGTIWKNIEKKYPGKIKITRIDIDQKDDLFTLIGDNTKYLSFLPLQNYDVIDLDSYGVPYEQLKIIFERKFKGLVFVTFIQSVMGRLQNLFLNDLGYTTKMINKCPSLFCKNGYEKLLHWLALKGVQRVIIRKHSRKCYLGFRAA
jgi:hypothetical protein